MRHLSTILLLFIILSFARNLYSQEEDIRWKLITTYRNYFYYVDTKTIETKEKFIQCWIKEIPTKKVLVDDKEVKYRLKNSQFYCAEKRISFFETYTYFRDDSNSLDTVAVNVNTIIPETLQEILFNSICK